MESWPSLFSCLCRFWKTSCENIGCFLPDPTSFSALFFPAAIASSPTTLALSRRHGKVVFHGGTEIRVSFCDDVRVWLNDWPLSNDAKGFLFILGVAVIKINISSSTSFLWPSCAHLKSFLAGRAAPASSRPLSTSSLRHLSSSLHHNSFLPHSVILNHSYYYFLFFFKRPERALAPSSWSSHQPRARILKASPLSKHEFVS